MEPPDRKGPERENGRLPVRAVPAAPIGTGPVPESARPAEETLIEVDGLLITLLPGGVLALVDSHPDGATSVISLGRRRREALAPFLRAEGAGEDEPDPGPADDASERASGSGADTAPEPGLEQVREDAPGPAPANGHEAGRAGGPRGLDVDWDLYDEQLKAAFLLEQYARGVAPEDLPPGWEAVLEALPAALTQRSQRTRTSGPRDTGGAAPGGSLRDG